MGKTISIGPEHVVQRISSTSAIAHPKKLLNATPQLGDVGAGNTGRDGTVEDVLAVRS